MKLSQLFSELMDESLALLTVLSWPRCLPARWLSATISLLG